MNLEVLRRWCFECWDRKVAKTEPETTGTFLMVRDRAWGAVMDCNLAR